MFNPRKAWQHSFVEIDHEIFYIYGHSVPSRRAVVCFWRKLVHKYWLTALIEDYIYPGKVWLGKLTGLT